MWGISSQVTRALYGLKPSRASWTATFNVTIRAMGFPSTIAEQDGHQVTAKPDGFKYYKFILIYVDDVFIVSHSPQDHLSRIQACYELNPTSIGSPLGYLGVNVEKVSWPGDPIGSEHWSVSAHICVSMQSGMFLSCYRTTAKVWNQHQRLSFQALFTNQNWILWGMWCRCFNFILTSCWGTPMGCWAWLTWCIHRAMLSLTISCTTQS